MRVRLFRVTRKGGGETVVLRHIDTTTDAAGHEVQWFALADDPGGCKWPMRHQEVSEYDWDRLWFIGVWPDEEGAAKYWFESSLVEEDFWSSSLS